MLHFRGREPRDNLAGDLDIEEVCCIFLARLGGVPSFPLLLREPAPAFMGSSRRVPTLCLGSLRATHTTTKQAADGIEPAGSTPLAAVDASHCTAPPDDTFLRTRASPAALAGPCVPPRPFRSFSHGRPTCRHVRLPVPTAKLSCRKTPHQTPT